MSAPAPTAAPAPPAPPGPLILGIESSCDETAAAVVSAGTHVLSSAVATQLQIHQQYGGVVPELASRAHTEHILPVVRQALADARLTLRDLDAIAVGHRPGLIGSLLVGVAAAKALSWALARPLIGVDHVHAHLYAGLLTHPQSVAASSAPAFPALGLVVSGGHTSLYLLESWTSLTRLGATIDDALGEAFDKAATILGLPYPGGPNLDALARTPGARADAVKFPISRLERNSLDFSFSGLKTALLYEVRPPAATRGKFAAARAALPVPPSPSPHAPIHTALPLSDDRRRDLAASFQRAAVAAVLLKLERAVDHLAARGIVVSTLLTGGGVTANSHLRAELANFAARRRLALALPALQFCVDNAAMIAGLAAPLLAAGHTADLTLEPLPTTAT